QSAIAVTLLVAPIVTDVGPKTLDRNHGAPGRHPGSLRPHGRGASRDVLDSERALTCWGGPARPRRVAAGGGGGLVSHREGGGVRPVFVETASGLKCRLCGKPYPKEALNFCTEDFGPLEVTYDYEQVARTMSRAAIQARPRSMWRYRELLPIDGEPTVGEHVGC